MEKKGIAIASRMDSNRAIKLAKEVYNFLAQKKKETVYLETRLAPKIAPYNGKDLISMTEKDTSFVVCIGGDGSLLRVANSMPQQNAPPILGVNIGSIGFLDESNERTVFKDLNKVLDNNFKIENCLKITPYIVKSNSERIKLNNALNEVLIVSSKNSKVLQVSIKINGVFLNRSYLDGVLISTPIGSTAYNLSAGGAIINPKLECMQIAALNPFARSGLKPIVVPLDSEIEVKLLRPRLNAKIVIDGQQTINKIQPNTKIIVHNANVHTKFIRFRESYYKRLKRIFPITKVPLSDSPEE